MNLTKNRLAALLLALVLTLSLGAALAETAEEAPVSDHFFAGMKLTNLDGTPFDTSVFLGKPILLNIWATWCPPCIREIPMLVEIQQELGEQGLQIVGIAVDKRDPARSFVHQLKVNYPVLYGVQSALEVSLLYGNDAGTLPHTAIVDRQGYIRHIIRGELEREQLLELVTSLL